jgi:hypothetical protein
MQYADLAQSDILADKVNINLDMLGAPMMNRIGRHVDCTHIVAINDSRTSNRDVELLKKLPKPVAFGDSMGDGMVLSLSTGAWDSGLALGRLGDQVVTEVDTVAGCGAPRVRTTAPVSIRVCCQRGDGAGADVKSEGEGADVKFVEAKLDTLLFVYRRGVDTIHLSFYVDDIVLTAFSPELLQRTTTALQREFVMKDLGPLHHVLSVSVEQRHENLFLHQC